MSDEEIESHIWMNKCGRCGLETDGITGPGAPESGSITICSRCGAISTFDDDLEIHLMSDEEIESLDSKTRDQLQEVVDYLMNRKDERISFQMIEVNEENIKLMMDKYDFDYMRALRYVTHTRMLQETYEELNDASAPLMDLHATDVGFDEVGLGHVDPLAILGMANAMIDAIMRKEGINLTSDEQAHIASIIGVVSTTAMKYSQKMLHGGRRIVE